MQTIKLRRESRPVIFWFLSLRRWLGRSIYIFALLHLINFLGNPSILHFLVGRGSPRKSNFLAKRLCTKCIKGTENWHHVWFQETALENPRKGITYKQLFLLLWLIENLILISRTDLQKETKKRGWDICTYMQPLFIFDLIIGELILILDYEESRVYIYI